MNGWSTGDRVGVVAGPFAGFSGTIERMENENHLFAVRVEIFGRVTGVLLRRDELGPDNGGPGTFPDFPDDGGDGGERQPRKPKAPSGDHGAALAERIDAD